MIPYEEAKAVYSREPCKRTFDEDVLLHLQFGFIFSTPEFFIMGRPVDSTAPAADVVNPGVSFPPESCDCWHIYLMAGNCGKAWSIMPWHLPLVSWERRNELRFYSAKEVERLSRPAA